MEVENKELFLNFDTINEPIINDKDEFIAKGLYLNDAINNDNLSVVDDLLLDIIEMTNEKEDSE